MRKLYKIKLILLLKIIHHILAQECVNKPAASDKSANTRVKCLVAGGCRLTCKTRYMFPTGEKSVYYECVEGNYKITENPENYKECKPICNPPCGNGGNCVRPNTCACLVGWTGNRCKQKITPKPIITTTPIYSENIVRTTHSSTALLQSTIPFNDRTSIEFNVTDILDETTQTDAAYLCTDTTDTTYNINENQKTSSVIPDSMDMSTEINVAHTEQTMQLSTDLLETTLNIDGDFREASIIIDPMDMDSSTNDNDIKTTRLPFTELLFETMKYSTGGLTITSEISDIIEMISTTDAAEILTTPQASTESYKSTINSNEGLTISSEITDILEMISTTNAAEILTTPQASTESYKSMININEGLTISSEITDILEMISTTDAAEILTTPQASTESYKSMINSNGGLTISSEITDIIEMISTTNVADILTTPQPSTDSSETTINSIGRSNVSFTIIDIKDTTSTIYDEDNKTTPTSFKDISQRKLDSDGDSSMSSPITDIIGMDSSMYDAEKEVTTQHLIEFIQTQMDNGGDTIDYTVPELSTEVPQSTVLDILPVTESTNYPKLNELSTLLEDSTKVSQEKMMTEEELFPSTDFFSIEKETELTYNATRSSILSTYKLNNFSTEETAIFHLAIGNHSNNNSERFSTQSTNIENSTSEIFLTTNLSYRTSFNISTHKNIISYILNNLGFGLQENADCGEPLWWLVPLLLAITALLTATNIILNILTLKWKKDLAELQKRIANHRKQSLPITFFRTLEFNAEMEYPVALSNDR